MNKKIKIAGITIIIVLLIGGILYYMNKKDNTAEVEYKPEEEISDEQLRQTIISLYFANKESNELIPEGRLIDVKLLLNDPYATLMKLLIEGPKNDKLEGTIPKDTKINKIELKKDILFIDLSKEFIDNHPGGEKKESNTVYSIVNTMTALTEVNGIKILIDGKENESFKDEKMNFKEAFLKLN